MCRAKLDVWDLAGMEERVSGSGVEGLTGRRRGGGGGGEWMVGSY